VLPNAEHRFVVGWTAAGWPADVQRLQAMAPDLEVVVAPLLSEGARSWLDAHRLGWVDEAGQASVSLPSGLIIFREPSVRTPRHEPSSGWTPATVGVAEAALAGRRGQPSEGGCSCRSPRVAVRREAWLRQRSSGGLSPREDQCCPRTGIAERLVRHRLRAAAQRCWRAARRRCAGAPGVRREPDRRNCDRAA
jgi:hypothetical protein